MADATTSVIVASASAVAKVFVIGAIGYVAAQRPRTAPLLPPQAMTAISKMNFNLLILPLVYSTLASVVTPEKVGALWSVLVAAVGVICLSYAVATVLGWLPPFRVENRVDFDALRIAAAFPNIVALPILIFPALCEFPEVHEAFYGGEAGSEVEMFRSCVDQSNSMIFVYFFAWNFLFWVLGHPTLVAAGQKRQGTGSALSVTEPHLPAMPPKSDCDEVDVAVAAAAQDGTDESNRGGSEDPEGLPAEEQSKLASDARRGIYSIFQLVANALIQTMKSPGFIAMALGFLTACIAPLREALFRPGGALRFFGSAMESLGSASSSVGTLVVAASLVHLSADDSSPIGETDAAPKHADCNASELGILAEHNAREHVQVDECTSNNERAPKDFRASLRRRRSSISQMSSRAITAIQHRKPTIRMHLWFIASRLVVAPALVCAAVVAIDCGGVMDILPMAKMVVIVNAGLPGAQLVVLTLKSEGLSDSASVVAKVYLPSYLLSAVTIAIWTALGLVISVPREDGTSFCHR